MRVSGGESLTIPADMEYTSTRTAEIDGKKIGCFFHNGWLVVGNDCLLFEYYTRLFFIVEVVLLQLVIELIVVEFFFLRGFFRQVLRTGIEDEHD